MDVSSKTKGQSIQWYNDVASNLSEENLKIEAFVFFGPEFDIMNKQTIARKLKELKKEHEKENVEINKLLIVDRK